MEDLLNTIIEANSLEKRTESNLRLAYRKFRQFLRGNVSHELKDYEIILPYIRDLDEQEIERAWLSVNYEEVEAMENGQVLEILTQVFTNLEDELAYPLNETLLEKLGLDPSYITVISSAGYLPIDVAEMIEMLDAIPENAKITKDNFRSVLGFLMQVHSDMNHEDIQKLWRIYMISVWSLSRKQQKANTYLESLKQKQKLK